MHYRSVENLGQINFQRKNLKSYKTYLFSRQDMDYMAYFERKYLQGQNVPYHGYTWKNKQEGDFRLDIYHLFQKFLAKIRQLKEGKQLLSVNPSQIQLGIDPWSKLKNLPPPTYLANDFQEEKRNKASSTYRKPNMEKTLQSMILNSEPNKNKASSIEQTQLNKFKQEKQQQYLTFCLLRYFYEIVSQDFHQTALNSLEYSILKDTKENASIIDVMKSFKTISRKIQTEKRFTSQLERLSLFNEKSVETITSFIAKVQFPDLKEKFDKQFRREMAIKVFEEISFDNKINLREETLVESWMKKYQQLIDDKSVKKLQKLMSKVVSKSNSTASSNNNSDISLILSTTESRDKVKEYHSVLEPISQIKGINQLQIMRQNQEFRRQIKNLEFEMFSQRKSSSDLKSVLAEHKSEMKKLKEKEAEYKKTIDDQQQKIQAFKADVSKFNQIESELFKNISDLSIYVNRSENHIQQLNESNQKLEAEVERLKMELDQDKKVRNFNKKVSIKYLHKEVGQMKELSESTKSEAESQKPRISSVNLQQSILINECKRQFEQIRKMKDQFEGEVNSKMRQVTEKQQRIESLQSYRNQTQNSKIIQKPYQYSYITERPKTTTIIGK